VGLCGAFLLSSGCGGIKRVPVSGTVTLDGKPIREGFIAFWADESKANNTVRASCSAPIRNGEFTLSSIGVTASESGPGVAPGWYKVILDTDRLGAPKTNVHPRFTNVAKTPLSVEVVEEPAAGAYDIKMTSK
jgi:hypothetical protein